MKILMSCFVPFGGDSVNASQLAVEGCRAPEGAELCKITVPVVFGEAVDFVCRAIDEEKPDVVICVGEAGGRKAVTPERVGINVMDARIPDNAGYQPVDVKIAPDGPDAYFSTLPIKEMVAAMNAEGFEAAVSNTAGTFVCNDLMYGVLHYLNTGYCAGDGCGSGAGKHRPIAGFIHVPADRPDADRPDADKPDADRPDADRPTTAEDGSLTPVPSTSADALTAALKALI